MKKEIIIRMQPGSGKCHKKALEVAATVGGVESITVTGKDKDLLLVIGDGVDTAKLTKKLKKKVGEAEIMDLRSPEALPGTSNGVVVAHPRSPYHCNSTPGRSLTGGGRVTYPVCAPPAVATSSPSYRYPRAHSPSYYHASPVAGYGGYGNGSSTYARAVARSHPANYSPMIERHDHRASGRWSGAGKRRHGHGHGCGARKPNCCSIL